MSAMYAVYHGPDGIRAIAKRVSALAYTLSKELEELGFENSNRSFFDSIRITNANATDVKKIAEEKGINFGYNTGAINISLDETTTQEDVLDILHVFAAVADSDTAVANFHADEITDNIPSGLVRNSPFLTHPVFNIHHSESQMMRYIKMLENKDLSLNTSMISLGSCTMKLNAATQLIPVSWPEFNSIHPFAPAAQWKGYQQIIDELALWLSKITGFAATSLPVSYTHLDVYKRQEDRGERR